MKKSMMKAIMNLNSYRFDALLKQSVTFIYDAIAPVECGSEWLQNLSCSLENKYANKNKRNRCIMPT